MAQEPHARIEAVEKELATLARDVGEDQGARKRLLGVLQQSLGMAEAPHETIWRHLFQPHVNASIRIALELGIFDTLNASQQPVSAADLAKASGADALLIIRILRPLAAMHIVIETEGSMYQAGPISQAFAQPALRGGFKHDNAALSCVRLPAFLAQTGYKSPDDPAKGNFQSSHNIDLPMFPWLMQNPQRMQDFMAMFEGWRVGRTEWFDIFPVQEKLLSNTTSTDPPALLVDVGGGQGYDLNNFHQRFLSTSTSSSPGALILQDLPHVIDAIPSLPLSQHPHASIKRMHHDFFTPQPIRGARAYYFRSICHDWSDERCRDILSNTVHAMGPDSRVLINEWILPDHGAGMIPATLDINMMSLLSGMERTVTQWRGLLDSVGLEVVKFWSLGDDTEGLIEAVRKS